MKTINMVKIAGLVLAAAFMFMAVACAGPHGPGGHQPGQGGASSPPPGGGGGPGGSSGPPQNSGEDMRVLSVSRVYADIHRLEGKVVSVKGMFMGWSVCRDNTAMRTRSDWVLSDGNRCVFVTGRPPGGLDPKNQSDRRRPAQIRALVVMEGHKVLLRSMDGR